MKNFTIIILSLFIISCGNSKKTVNQQKEMEEKAIEKPHKKAILVQDWNKYRDTAPYNILDINLKGNIITLDIDYSGGCKVHEFDLVGSVFIMKSLPPKRGIKLFHNSNGDDCREKIITSIHFDISEFAYANGEIILNLEHYKESIRYNPEK